MILTDFHAFILFLYAHNIKTEPELESVTFCGCELQTSSSI